MNLLEFLCHDAVRTVLYTVVVALGAATVTYIFLKIRG